MLHNTDKIKEVEGLDNLERAIIREWDLGLGQKDKNIVIYDEFYTDNVLVQKWVGFVVKIRDGEPIIEQDKRNR